MSDYLKGTVTRALVARLAALAQARGVPLLVDPKIPHLDYYAGATLITPNHHEAEIATHLRIRGEADARTAARAFRDRAGAAGVLITRGEHGMWLLDDAFEGHLPATAREVADVTGAGDTVIATLGLALAAGAHVGRSGPPRQLRGRRGRRQVRPGDGHAAGAAAGDRNVATTSEHARCARIRRRTGCGRLVSLPDDRVSQRPRRAPRRPFGTRVLVDRTPRDEASSTRTAPSERRHAHGHNRASSDSRRSITTGHLYSRST